VHRDRELYDLAEAVHRGNLRADSAVEIATARLFVVDSKL